MVQKRRILVVLGTADQALVPRLARVDPEVVVELRLRLEDVVAPVARVADLEVALAHVGLAGRERNEPLRTLGALEALGRRVRPQVGHELGDLLKRQWTGGAGVDIPGTRQTNKNNFGVLLVFFTNVS